jgi:hypothetical protein
MLSLRELNRFLCHRPVCGYIDWLCKQTAMNVNTTSPKEVAAFMDHLTSYESYCGSQVLEGSYSFHKEKTMGRRKGQFSSRDHTAHDHVSVDMPTFSDRCFRTRQSTEESEISGSHDEYQFSCLLGIRLS